MQAIAGAEALANGTHARVDELAELRARASELRAVNAQIKKARGARRYVLDRKFHAMLWERGTNRALVALLSRLWLEAKRFDGGTERGMADPTGSLRAHAAIVDAIARGDLDAAGDLAAAHWRHGVEVVVGWMTRKRGTAKRRTSRRNARCSVGS
ncbi:MAG: FCD domain-containing protein [Kofleriaceae bacterium]